jgi:hypothetical protein
LGSLHLLAPNPVFRYLRVRPDGEPKNRSRLVVTFVPRNGRSVEGLMLIHEEERPTGLGVLLSVTLDVPIVRIPMPSNPGSVRGLPPVEFPVPLFDVVASCITIRGSFVGTRQDMVEALAIAADGKVKADIELQPLSAINKLFERLERADGASRVVLEFAPV